MNRPIILERADKHLMGLDLASKLMQDRIIMLDEVIDDEFASQVITQLLYLKNISKDPITMFVKGPGGSIYDGLGIYDMMENVKASGVIIKTRGIGIAASMQSFLLSAGSPGERKVFPNCTIMIHQPSMGAVGQVTEVEIAYKEGQRLKDRLTDLYIQHGADPKVRELMDRDKWLTAQESLELGLIDGIL
jgi:ATP-dependent Clp protease protease subunit